MTQQRELYISMWQIGKAMKMDEPETRATVCRLTKSGLVRHVIAGGLITISRFGRNRIGVTGKRNP